MRFQLRRSENEDDDENDSRNDGERGGQMRIASRILSRRKAGRFADALGRLERVALAPRQSLLNIVLVVVLVLVLDFRDASDKPSRLVPSSAVFFAQPVELDMLRKKMLPRFYWSATSRDGRRSLLTSLEEVRRDALLTW
jgi:hypothetical protein